MNERRGGALQPYPKGMEGSPARLSRALAAAMVSRRVGGSAIRRIMTLGGVVAAVLLLLPAIPTAALSQAMNLVVLAPEGDYSVGDSVTLTIHVFKSGFREDATSIDASIRAGPADRALAVAKIGTGVYESTFQILPSDVIAGAVKVRVDASIGNLRDYRILYVFLEDVSLQVTASAVRVSPGDAVDLTVWIRENGLLRDSDTLVLTASVLMVGGDGETQELQLSHAALGTYVATYVIPASIAQDTALSFVAWDPARSRGSSGVVVFVDVPTRLLVWSHDVVVGPYDATLEILVANETGWPEEGAYVDLHYGYVNQFLYLHTQNASTLTDAQGVASFDLAYPGSQSTVGFWGTVSKGSATQGFSGSIVPDAFVRNPGIEVRRENPLDIFVPGETTSLRYMIIVEETPIVGQTLYYYARTKEALVAHGSVESDAEGRFTLNFAIPAGYTTIEFASQVGPYWIYDRDVALGANRLSVDVGDIHVGSITHITATLPDTSTPWIALVSFFPYRYAQGLLTSPWALASGTFTAYDVSVSMGATLDHVIVVPRFLPKGEDYMLFVYAFPFGPVITDSDAYVYIRTIRIENRPPVAHAELSSPVVAIGSEVEVNASASSDKDGAVDAYEMDWGDGTATGWSANATATHSYGQPGDYIVTVRVRDDDGAAEEASFVVRVEAMPVGIPPLTFIAIVLSVAYAAAAAAPIIGRKVIRALAKPGGTVARYAV